VGPAWKSVTIGSPFLPTAPVCRWAAITLSILVTFILYSMESPKFSNHTQPLADELLGGISFSPLRVAKNFCPRALTRKGGSSYQSDNNTNANNYYCHSLFIRIHGYEDWVAFNIPSLRIVSGVRRPFTISIDLLS
jgi:hypothetical protein